MSLKLVFEVVALAHVTLSRGGIPRVLETFARTYREQVFVSLEKTTPHD